MHITAEAGVVHIRGELPTDGGSASKAFLRFVSSLLKTSQLFIDQKKTEIRGTPGGMVCGFRKETL